MIAKYEILLLGGLILIFNCFSQLNSKTLIIYTYRRVHKTIIDQKIGCCTKRISSKTKKLPAKFSNREQKINKALNKINFKAGNKLFTQKNKTFIDANNNTAMISYLLTQIIWKN